MRPRYLRMLSRMQENGSSAASQDWSVYIVRCSDDTLYTGIAKDLDKRLARHNAGKGAAYTRTRRPVALQYHETGLSRSDALVREAGIKALPRDKKEKLCHRGGKPPPAKRTRA